MEKLKVKLKPQKPSPLIHPNPDSLPTCKAIRVPLQHILKDIGINQPKLNHVVIMAHKICINTLQYLKIYILVHYDVHAMSIITQKLINTIMKILCDRNARGRKPKQETQDDKEALNDFYRGYYEPLILPERLTYTHMNAILEYLSTSILTIYENNIKQNYIRYITKYVDTVWHKKMIIDKIKLLFLNTNIRKKRISKFCTQLQHIKDDIICVNGSPFKSHPRYHSWIIQSKELLIPSNHIFQKNSIHYDIVCTPQVYYPHMIFMGQQFELYETKLYNVFPQRTEIIPKSIKIDTTSLVYILLRPEMGMQSYYASKGNIVKKADEIWNFFFHTDKFCFYKKYYSFHHMIDTDGISCSIIFLRNDLVGKPLPDGKRHPIPELYIDELTDLAYSVMKNKTIASIDIGFSDLLYCVDGDERDRKHFRYTQNQRRKETKSKKFRNIRNKLKKEIIDGKTIIEWETELSLYNSKTLDIDKYSTYIEIKNRINARLFVFYEQFIFRKLQLNSYLNTVKSEQKLINNFKRIFGKPDDVIVAIGDFEQRNNRKYFEPTMGKGFRTLFRKYGYKVFLVDEFRTSCKCSECELDDLPNNKHRGRCYNFKWRKSPKPKKTHQVIVHGVLKCKTCGAIWNRDENGSRNIYKIAYDAINGYDRPEFLCR